MATNHFAPISNQLLTTARVDFKPEKFNTLVEQKGLILTHEYGVKCSCIREVNGASLPNCNLCNGCGWTYHDPWNVKGVIQAINYNPKIAQYSEINLGTALLTTRYTDRLGWYDKITVEEGESIFSENVFPILRGTGIQERCSALLTYVPIDFEQPLGSYVTMTAFVFQDVNTSLQLVYSDTPTAINEFGLDGREFLLNPILLTQLKNSNVDKYYVGVRYKHKPEYIVMDIQKNIRNTNVLKVGKTEELKHMPIHCTIKKTHYLLNSQGLVNAPTAQ